MKPVKRRKFIKDMAKITAGTLVGGYFIDSTLFNEARASTTLKASVFVSKNGTPAENVAKVIEMRFGGIEHFIGPDDVVVINPNGQWTNQGGSNCACCMGLIDLILYRPGGFNGEILFVENTQFNTEGYWTAFGDGLLRNGPYNFNDMIAYYHSQGHDNVSGFRLWNREMDWVNWPVITGPEEGQGWVRPAWQSPVSGVSFYLPYPVMRSPYSNRLIDLKNGVYDNGYEDQPTLKYIKMPNLNNHGTAAEQDFAGITSAVKSFLGIAEMEGVWQTGFDDGHKNLHTFHNDIHGNLPAQKAYACGEAVGAWMQFCRKPDLFITTAEWVGWGGRSENLASQKRTVGLADDPVSLDYYMSKYVLWPCYPPQNYFDPDYDIDNNMTRQTMNGCHSRGFGTVTGNEIGAYVYDFTSPRTFRFDIDRMILKFRNGEATQQEVLNLIEKYNQGL